jgi:hypothetical protein
MRRTIGLLSFIALLGGCGDERITTVTLPSAQADEAVTSASKAADADEQKDLSTLRQVTARFFTSSRPHGTPVGRRRSPRA